MKRLFFIVGISLLFGDVLCMTHSEYVEMLRSKIANREQIVDEFRTDSFKQDLRNNMGDDPCALAALNHLLELKLRSFVDYFSKNSENMSDQNNEILKEVSFLIAPIARRHGLEDVTGNIIKIIGTGEDSLIEQELKHIPFCCQVMFCCTIDADNQKSEPLSQSFECICTDITWLCTEYNHLYREYDEFIFKLLDCIIGSREPENGDCSLADVWEKIGGVVLKEAKKDIIPLGHREAE